MLQKICKVLFFCAALTTLSLVLYRDFTIGCMFPVDLRNRVVGARLILDGASPYFYKWKAGDPVRYYDPENFDRYKASVMTASPFFHHLIAPLAELPQWKIQRWWVAIQYLALLAMVLLSLSAARTPWAKYLIPTFTILFLYTESWKDSIQNGQNYLIIPLLAMCVYYVLVRKPATIVWAAVAGACSIILVLIRPNALIFFLPAIFLLKDFGRARLMAFFIPVLLLAGWTAADPRERTLWIDYRANLGEQLKIHQKLHPAEQQNAPDPHYRVWEGIDQSKEDAFHKKLPMNVHPENGNIFYLEYLSFHRKMSVSFLLSTLVVILLTLTVLYYFRAGRSPHLRTAGYDTATTLMFGYCLYMLADLFSPIFRSQYYTVQVLFLVLLSPGIPRFAGKWVQGSMLAGIILNITNFPFFKMQHTIGEFLIIGIIILFSLSDDPKLNE